MNRHFTDIKIGDVCQVGDGAHTSIKRKESGVLYLSSRNFKDGGLDLTKVYYISEEDFNKHFKDGSKAITKTKAGDVALSIIGTIGEPYIVKPTDRFGLSSAVAFLRPNEELVNSEYLYYWLKGPEFQQAVYNIKGGVAQGYVSLEMIKGLPFRQFSKIEQNKISSFLKNYDNLIENNNRRIAILEDMAQSLYREWFVNFRYQNHKDNLDAGGNPKLVDSSLGQIPEGWEVKEFSTSIDFWNGKKCVSSESGEFDLYGANGIIGKAEGWKYENAVIIGRVGAYCGAVEYCFDRFWGSDNTIIAKCKSEKNISYLFSLLEHFNLNKFAGGSAQPLLTQTTLKQLKYIAPPENLVEQFELMVHKLFESVVNLKKRNKNLKQQRDMLLPKLISGQIKL